MKVKTLLELLKKRYIRIKEHFTFFVLKPISIAKISSGLKHVNFKKGRISKQSHFLCHLIIYIPCSVLPFLPSYVCSVNFRV